jgi:hypothetical protein
MAKIVLMFRQSIEGCVGNSAEQSGLFAESEAKIESAVQCLARAAEKVRMASCTFSETVAACAFPRERHYIDRPRATLRSTED